MSGSLEKRIADLERRVKNKNCGVGLILPMDGVWRLFFNGSAKDFSSEEAAAEAFYRKAGAAATLILW